jgi:hypothetical protein
VRLLVLFTKKPVHLEMLEIQNTSKTNYLLLMATGDTRVHPKQAERFAVFVVNAVPVLYNCLLRDQ